MCVPVTSCSISIHLFQVVCDNEDKFLKLLELLGLYQEDGSVLVFVDKQEHADEVCLLYRYLTFQQLDKFDFVELVKANHTLLGGMFKNITACNGLCTCKLLSHEHKC